VGMETLSGVASEPQTQAVEKKTMLRFKVDSRSVELEPARRPVLPDSRRRRRHGGGASSERSSGSARVLEPVLGLCRPRFLSTGYDRRSALPADRRCHFGRCLGSPK
jgi:hypothetical protein